MGEFNENEFAALNFESEFESLLGHVVSRPGPPTSENQQNQYHPPLLRQTIAIASPQNDEQPQTSYHNALASCSSCERYKMDLERLGNEHRVNFQFLKKKIINTDLLIRRFKAKQDDCEQQTKTVDSLNQKLEQALGDSSILSDQLQSTLDSIKPLEEKNSELESELKVKSDEIGKLHNRLAAEEAFRNQKSALDLETSNIQEKMISLKKQNNSLQNKNQRLQVKTSELEDLRDALRGDNKTCRKKIQTLARALQKAQATVSHQWQTLLAHGLKTGRCPSVIPLSCRSTVKNANDEKSIEANSPLSPGEESDSDKDPLAFLELSDDSSVSQGHTEPFDITNDDDSLKKEDQSIPSKRKCHKRVKKNDLQTQLETKFENATIADSEPELNSPNFSSADDIDLELPGDDTKCQADSKREPEKADTCKNQTQLTEQDFPTQKETKSENATVSDSEPELNTPNFSSASDVDLELPGDNTKCKADSKGKAQKADTFKNQTRSTEQDTGFSETNLVSIDISGYSGLDSLGERKGWNSGKEKREENPSTTNNVLDDGNQIDNERSEKNVEQSNRLSDTFIKRKRKSRRKTMQKSPVSSKSKRSSPSKVPKTDNSLSDLSGNLYFTSSDEEEVKTRSKEKHKREKDVVKNSKVSYTNTGKSPFTSKNKNAIQLIAKSYQSNSYLSESEGEEGEEEDNGRMEIPFKSMSEDKGRMEIPFKAISEGTNQRQNVHSKEQTSYPDKVAYEKADLASFLSFAAIDNIISPIPLSPCPSSVSDVNYEDNELGPFPLTDTSESDNEREVANFANPKTTELSDSGPGNVEVASEKMDSDKVPEDIGINRTFQFVVGKGDGSFCDKNSSQTGQSSSDTLTEGSSLNLTSESSGSSTEVASSGQEASEKSRHGVDGLPTVRSSTPLSVQKEKSDDSVLSAIVVKSSVVLEEEKDCVIIVRHETGTVSMQYKDKFQAPETKSEIQSQRVDKKYSPHEAPNVDLKSSQREKQPDTKIDAEALSEGQGKSESDHCISHTETKVTSTQLKDQLIPSQLMASIETSLLQGNDLESASEVSNMETNSSSSLRDLKLEMPHIASGIEICLSSSQGDEELDTSQNIFVTENNSSSSLEDEQEMLPNKHRKLEVSHDFSIGSNSSSSQNKDKLEMPHITSNTESNSSSSHNEDKLEKPHITSNTESNSSSSHHEDKVEMPHSVSNTESNSSSSQQELEKLEQDLQKPHIAHSTEFNSSSSHQEEMEKLEMPHLTSSTEANSASSEQEQEKLEMTHLSSSTEANSASSEQEQEKLEMTHLSSSSEANSSLSQREELEQLEMPHLASNTEASSSSLHQEELEKFKMTRLTSSTEASSSSSHQEELEKFKMTHLTSSTEASSSSSHQEELEKFKMTHLTSSIEASSSSSHQEELEKFKMTHLTSSIEASSSSSHQEEVEKFKMTHLTSSIEASSSSSHQEEVEKFKNTHLASSIEASSSSSHQEELEKFKMTHLASSIEGSSSSSHQEELEKFKMTRLASSIEASSSSSHQEEVEKFKITHLASSIETSSSSSHQEELEKFKMTHLASSIEASSSSSHQEELEKLEMTHLASSIDGSSSSSHQEEVEKFKMTHLASSIEASSSSSHQEELEKFKMTHLASSLEGSSSSSHQEELEKLEMPHFVSSIEGSSSSSEQEQEKSKMPYISYSGAANSFSLQQKKLEQSNNFSGTETATSSSQNDSKFEPTEYVMSARSVIRTSSNGDEDGEKMAIKGIQDSPNPLDSTQPTKRCQTDSYIYTKADKRLSTSQIKQTVDPDAKRPSTSQIKQTVDPDAKRPSTSQIEQTMDPDAKRPSTCQIKQTVDPDAKRPSISQIKQTMEPDAKRPSTSQIKQTVDPDAKRPSTCQIKQTMDPDAKRPSTSQIEQTVDPDAKRPSTCQIKQTMDPDAKRQSTSQIEQTMDPDAKRPSTSQIKQTMDPDAKRQSTSQIEKTMDPDAKRQSTSQIKQTMDPDAKRPSTCQIKQTMDPDAKRQSTSQIEQTMDPDAKRPSTSQIKQTMDPDAKRQSTSQIKQTMDPDAKRPSTSQIKQTMDPDAKRPSTSQIKQTMDPDAKRPSTSQIKQTMEPDAKRPSTSQIKQTMDPDAKRPSISQIKQTMEPDAKRPSTSQIKQTMDPDAKRQSTSQIEKTMDPDAKRQSTSQIEQTMDPDAKRQSTSQIEKTMDPDAKRQSTSQIEQTMDLDAKRQSTSQIKQTVDLDAKRPSTSQIKQTMDLDAKRTSTSQIEQTMDPDAKRQSTSQIEQTMEPDAKRTSISQMEQTMDPDAKRQSTSQIKQTMDKDSGYLSATLIKTSLPKHRRLQNTARTVHNKIDSVSGSVEKTSFTKFPINIPIPGCDEQQPHERTKIVVRNHRLVVDGSLSIEELASQLKTLAAGAYQDMHDKRVSAQVSGELRNEKKAATSPGKMNDKAAKNQISDLSRDSSRPNIPGSKMIGRQEGDTTQGQSDDSQLYCKESAESTTRKGGTPPHNRSNSKFKEQPFVVNNPEICNVEPQSKPGVDCSELINPDLDDDDVPLLIVEDDDVDTTKQTISVGNARDEDEKKKLVSSSALALKGGKKLELIETSPPEIIVSAGTTISSNDTQVLQSLDRNTEISKPTVVIDTKGLVTHSATIEGGEHHPFQSLSKNPLRSSKTGRSHDASSPTDRDVMAEGYLSDGEIPESPPEVRSSISNGDDGPVSNNCMDNKAFWKLLEEMENFYRVPPLLSPLNPPRVSCSGDGSSKAVRPSKVRKRPSGDADKAAVLEKGPMSSVVTKKRFSPPDVSTSASQRQGDVGESSAVKPSMRRKGTTKEELAVVKKVKLIPFTGFGSVLEAVKCDLRHYLTNQSPDVDATRREMCHRAQGRSAVAVWPDVIKAVVSHLKNCDEDVLGRLLLAGEKERSPSQVFVAKSETSLMNLLVSFMKREQGVPIKDLMEALWYAVFDRQDMSLNARMGLCRMFTSLCKEQDDQGQVKNLLFNVAWCGYLDFPRCFLSVIGVWSFFANLQPEDLSSSGVCLVFEFILSHLDKKKTEESFLSQMLAVVETSCQWNLKKSKWNGEELLKKLLDSIEGEGQEMNLKAFDAMKGMELLMVHMGCPWTQDHFLQRQAVSVVNIWRFGKEGAVPQHRITAVFKLIRTVLSGNKSCNAKTVKILLSQLFSKAVEKNSRIQDLEMALGEALMEVVRFQPERSLALLSKWQEHNKDIIPNNILVRLMQLRCTPPQQTPVTGKKKKNKGKQKNKNKNQKKTGR